MQPVQLSPRSPRPEDADGLNLRSDAPTTENKVNTVFTQTAIPSESPPVQEAPTSSLSEKELFSEGSRLKALGQRMTEETEEGEPLALQEGISSRKP